MWARRHSMDTATTRRSMACLNSLSMSNQQDTGHVLEDVEETMSFVQP